jgi:3-oxoacyl-[acyl-carrier-protein] synthase III
MRVPELYLAGIGGYLPERVSTEHAVAEGWYDEQARQAGRVLSVAIEAQVAAPDMAVRAAERALKMATSSGHTGNDVAALVHSCTYHQGPDGWSAPHYVLRHTLGGSIPAMELRQGCLGMLAGLDVAVRRLLTDESETAVLLTTGDNFSTPLVDRWRASGLFLFADAGAAMVVSRRAGIARIRSVVSMSDPQMEALHRGEEPLLPPGVTQGDPLDFEKRINYWRRRWAAGEKPPINNFGERVRQVSDRALAEAGVGMERIARVCHVGFNWGPLHAMFLEPLEIDADRGVWEFSATVGHTGVADLALGLEHLIETSQVGAGDHVLLVGAATGMEAAATVLEIVGSA